jgi:PHD/YefM family antitoxin component YafN of YafNO toxin-antitoxin module
MKLSRDIQSLSVFKRDTSKFLRQIKKTGEPIILTVNGKAAIILTVNGKAAAVVLDPDSYQEYLREKDRQETIAGVKRGIADMRAGRVREAEDVFRELEAKFGIPSDI